MADIIQLLPDAVANQIAAGEVIQRPASVVKEMVENSVDSGADNIKVIVKDAGKTLVQVIDNGVGMSETDSRLAFERHATSKIKSADDLFGIRTKGFRGEALASIASIAHVTLKTRQSEQELGTQLTIAGSKVEVQEPVSCPQGSNLMVKNLFFNVPARRKFLKSNTTEFKHILVEFQRIALAHPDIEFQLLHNDQTILHLPQTNLRQRIVHIFGKQINQNLNNIDNNTSMVLISGFIGKPEFAKKTSGEQYFFINQRYMRHPYFHRAVTKAFENILPSDHYPSYFIYFDADPQNIDVNIHPTKTEIKFENEQAIFKIIVAAVRETLGKTNVIPSIDFDTHGVIDIPVLKKNTPINTPDIPLDHSFNPFNDKPPKQKNELSANRSFESKKPTDNWQKLYDGLEKSAPHNEAIDKLQLFSDEEQDNTSTKTNEYLQLKNKYILTSVKSGLMIIDQRHAHIRILYEKFIRNMALNRSTTQRSLYPDKIDLNNEDYLLIKEILDDLSIIGFDISDLGGNTIVINGVPDTKEDIVPQHLLEQMLEEYKNIETALQKNVKDKIAISLARASAISYGKYLTNQEMQHLVDELFACENPNYSVAGKKTLSLVNLEELEKFLN